MIIGVSGLNASGKGEFCRYLGSKGFIPFSLSDVIREELMEKHAREVKADEKEVERLYRASIKEYKVESVFLEKEENAKEMESELKEGKNENETLFLGIKDDFDDWYSGWVGGAIIRARFTCPKG